MTTNKSPCTQNCAVENGVCIGCNRTLTEIAGWANMSEEERATVLKRIEERAKE